MAAIDTARIVCDLEAGINISPASFDLDDLNFIGQKSQASEDNE
jgi:hypothetical protein